MLTSFSGCVRKASWHLEERLGLAGGLGPAALRGEAVRGGVAPLG